MKKMILPLSAACMILASCGGWSANGKEEFKTACEKAGMLDCNCALEKTMKKYPNQSDFNESGGKDMDLAKEIAEGCLKQ